MTETVNPIQNSIFKRLESRAGRLRKEAYVFLALVVVLLMFGGVVVYQAAQITSSDIGQSLNDRMATTNAESAKLSARHQENLDQLGRLLKNCKNTYDAFFDPWHKISAPAPDDHAYHAVDMGNYLPVDGKEIADKISSVLSSDDPCLSG